MTFYFSTQTCTLNPLMSHPWMQLDMCYKFIETYVCINEKGKKKYDASKCNSWPRIFADYKRKRENLILFRLDPEAGCLICFTLCSLTLIAASAKEEAACPWV